LGLVITGDTTHKNTKINIDVIIHSFLGKKVSFMERVEKNKVLLRKSKKTLSRAIHTFIIVYCLKFGPITSIATLKSIMNEAIHAKDKIEGISMGSEKFLRINKVIMKKEIIRPTIGASRLINKLIAQKI
jgi:hypothetical protein